MRPREWRAGRALGRDADVLVAVAVGDAAGRDEQDQAAGAAGADRGGGPVEALVDVLDDGRGGSTTTGSPELGESGVAGRALAAGAASAPAMRPAVARRVMRCETFMTASFRGGRGVDADDGLEARSTARSTRGLLSRRPPLGSLPPWMCGCSGRSRFASGTGRSSWARASSGRVLAMLALEPGRTVSADRLAEGLWGEPPPPSAPKMVQLYVSHLRRVLDGDGARIVTRGRGYELQLADGDGRRGARRASARASRGRARRSRCGAASRSPTSPTSRSRRRRSGGSRSCACARPSWRSTPTSRPAAMPR